MIPFIVLAFCCSFFCSRATPLPSEFSDCDDPDVFKAVDAALKKYNGDRATGNQFALYVVMEAERTAGPDAQFYVKYRIFETTCAIEENKPWQHCQYKPSAEAKTGECIARVYMNDAEKTSNVSQDCKISSDVSKIRVTQVPCLGCFHPLSTDSSQVSEIMQRAIQKFNEHSTEPTLFKLVEIKEARRQVVAGWNYKIIYEIEETNCSKEQFADLTPECRTTSRGRVGKCEAKAYQNLQAQIEEIKNECNFSVSPAICPGCPKSISETSPELKKLLRVSMEKYNRESNDDFHYKEGQVHSATVQVVAGLKYQVKFRAWKTNCSKKEFEELNEDCEVTLDSAPLSCDAQIYVRPWMDEIISNVNCSEEYTAVTFQRRPPGFTPFRQAPPSRTVVNSPSLVKETRKDDGQELEGKGEPEHKREHKHRHGYKKDHESDKRHRHEIGCRYRTGHRRRHKNHSKSGKRKHPNPKSSEESSERGFNQNKTLQSSELANPGVPRKETSTSAVPLIVPDTFLFNGLPDRPESSHPRCPGKPWKQIMDLPASPSFPREFTNEDLLPSAAENIDPAPENEKEGFDLADAIQ